MKREWVQDLMYMFFPKHCPFCDAVVAPDCNTCASCAESEALEPFYFRIRFSPDFLPVACYMPYAYDGTVRSSILAFKFQGRKDYAGFYAQKIQQVLEQSSVLPFDVLAAVPMTRGRKQERGYNQAEEIARKLSALLQVPYKELLRKCRNNAVQHELPLEERLENVKNVYRVKNPELITGKRILLLDDIMTSGATLGACCKILYEAGAQEVSCAAVAHVK